MSAEPFVDTNIWVYAHTAEQEDIRGPVARALVDDGRRFVISTQIEDRLRVVNPLKVTDARKGR